MTFSFLEQVIRDEPVVNNLLSLDSNMDLSRESIDRENNDMDTSEVA